MTDTPLRSIVVVGGGTAGWMSAALLSKLLSKSYSIRLVESDEIATIGVGEATIPAIKQFNLALDIDEDDFLRRTQGTFKMGIQFVNWARIGDSYLHGFGRIGQDWDLLRCHQYWLKMHLQGEAPPFGHFAINTVAPLQGRFMRSRPDMPKSPLADIAYAFHFDASLYARFLRDYAQRRGVRRTEGKIVRTELHAESGHIDAVVLESGEKVAGDLFIDCSGIRGLLIGAALGTPFEDWSHWLPCNRAIAVPCVSDGSLLPYTRSTAHGAGWQWRIPLQHRTGNGHVYSSGFIGDDEATDVLMKNLDGAPLAPPRYIRYTPGKRRQIWNRNCIAIGLSSGFLEPLESTSIHLIQSGLVRLTKLLPTLGFSQVEVDHYNRAADFEYERIRDFLILHYKATTRDDSPFWNYCRTMSIPDTLRQKIDMFGAHGRIFKEGEELFNEESWIQVMLGQGVIPADYDPLVDSRSEEEVRKFLHDIESVIGKCVNVMPMHKDFIAAHCAATAP